MTSCVHEWVKLLLPPVFSIILGGLVVQRFFARRANQAAFVDHIIKELGELRDNSLQYWALAAASDNREKIKTLEAQIKGRVLSLTSDLRCFAKEHRSICQCALNWVRRVQNHEGPEYLVTMLSLFDICTGGDFETEQHKADPSKYLPISSTISKVKSELLRLKL